MKTEQDRESIELALQLARYTKMKIVNIRHLGSFDSCNRDQAK